MKKPVAYMAMTQNHLKRNGRQEWTVLNLERSTAERLAALLTDGIPQKEIPEMFGLTKGAVSKAKKKAKALGLIMIEGSKFPVSRA
ncbi:MAG: hypothetical protein JRE18_02630 [Deltaproteobacteria bacterium]|nr:hypothetical protein [Deltaproteobacteria bacterium]